MSGYWQLHSGRPHTRDPRYMTTRKYGGQTYTGRRGGRRPFRRRAPTTTALRRAGIVIPRIQARQRGYLRVGGYYGRFSNGGELKFHDVDVDDAVVATAGTIQNGGTVNVIAQDVTESTRVGRKCTIKKIHWKYQITLPNTASATETSDSVRVILYLDKQTNGLTAAVTDILATANYQSFRALDNVGRFVIFLDKVHKISTMGGIGGATLLFAENQNNYTFNKNCNIPIEYDASANTGVLTTIRTNNLCVLLISQGGFAGFDSKMRLRFSDS